ncbi:hypothetical protein L7F22_026242 [Adiantum nelumboides]|nr:hypothetical protein [Adiantum nelumboides]
MGRVKRPEWQYVDQVKACKKGQWTCKCKFCGHTWDGGPARIRYHLLKITGHGVGPCDQVPDAVKEVVTRLHADARGDGTDRNDYVNELVNAMGEEASQSVNDATASTHASDSSKSKKRKGYEANLGSAFHLQARKHADQALRRFFYAEDIPEWKVRSPFFLEMVKAIGQAGPSYVPPSHHALRTTHLNDEVKCIKSDLMAYAWTHMILFVVFTQSAFTVANIFEGIIWFLLPASLIVINDIAAYICGFFIGRTPLIKLSPKKTWEGFVGASIVTVISAGLLANLMGRSLWLTCPRKDLSTGPLYCDPGPLFKPRQYELPLWFSVREVSILPVQTHALVFGLFASIIAPFGGFFASGFKRAFKIKDFGDSIPGHGGITDRMDCQMVMAVFSYIYYQSFIAPLNITVDDLMDQILQTLTLEQQVELYKELGKALYRNISSGV